VKEWVSGENEEGVKYHEIERDKLISFALFRDGKPLLRYHFDQPGLKLICRRRVFKTPGEEDKVFFLVGWQKTVVGKDGKPESLQSLSVVGKYPDGTMSIEVVSKWHENHALFDAIVPLECEGEDPVST
jgi:hypothetical protein